jgi:hypothetical protein
MANQRRNLKRLTPASSLTDSEKFQHNKEIAVSHLIRTAIYQFETIHPPILTSRISQTHIKRLKRKAS